MLKREIKDVVIRKVHKGELALVRQRFLAAVSLLLVAAVLLTTSTFAWLVISTEPEITGISTSVTGNGSLEVALMPPDGSMEGISSGGMTSAVYAGGGTPDVFANASWGNLVNLQSSMYGLSLVSFRPVQMDVGDLVDGPFHLPSWGSDGRITALSAGALRSHYTVGFGVTDGFTGNAYGVRAIVDAAGDTYGYVIDLAIRTNGGSDEEPGKLLLQAEGVQRVYAGGYSDATQGGGSNMWFRDENGEEIAGLDVLKAQAYLEAVRIAFIENLGSSTTYGYYLLATARVNPDDGSLYLLDEEGQPRTGEDADVILQELRMNQPRQLSVVVYLDGDVVENANMTIDSSVLNTAMLNLQFATDIPLIPAENTGLRSMDGVEISGEGGILTEGIADDISWRLFSNGELVITGEGPIVSHPWTSYLDYIQRVTIDQGVTTIGEDAFRGCTALTAVIIPDTVTTIGNYAFCDCYRLTSVTIPDSVTSIGSGAFRNCYSLTAITVHEDNPFYSDVDGVLFSKDGKTLVQYPAGKSGNTYAIPSGVTSIGDDAFYNCDSLTSVTIPNSVTRIGGYAFYNCGSLTSVTIPDSVTSIGDHAFYSCDILTAITVHEDNPFYSDVDGVLFSKDGKTLVQYPAGKSGNTYAIPSGVTSIGDDAFYNCDRLTSVTIPDSVTSIGDYAFSGCHSLTSVTIPDSVTSIGKYAFSGCDSLTSVTIPDSVTSIGYRAFYHCDSLTAITVHEDNPFYADVDGVLFSKDGKTLVQYPAGKSGNTYAIPSGVTSIGDYAFENCDRLTSVTIPDSVTSIGNVAFSGCHSLTSVTIPDSVTSIGNQAFSGCDSLTSVTIPDSVTIIGDEAFYKCSSLTDVYYSGSQAQWNTVIIGAGNHRLTSATIRYNAS